jgi:hypothetical protein
MLLTFYLSLIIYFYGVVRPTSSFPPLQYTMCPSLPSCSSAPLDGTYVGAGVICHGLWRQGYPSSRWLWSSFKPCFYLRGGSMHEKVNGCNSIPFSMVALQASSAAVPIPGRSSTRASSSLSELDMSPIAVYKMGPLPFFNLLVLSPGQLATQYQPKDWYINIFGPWFGGLFGYNSSTTHNKVSGFWCRVEAHYSYSLWAHLGSTR